MFVIVWEVCVIRRPGRPSPPYRATRDVLAGPRHREHPRAAAMRTVGRWLVAGWLLTALGVLGIDGRLPGFPAWTAPISLLALICCAGTPAACVIDLGPDPSAATLPGGDADRRPLAEVVAVANKKPALDCGRHQMIERPGLSATPLSQGR